MSVRLYVLIKFYSFLFFECKVIERLGAREFQDGWNGLYLSGPPFITANEYKLQL